MKQLTDSDIAKMIGDDFIPDDIMTKKAVRTQLHLSKRIPKPDTPAPEHMTIDFHNHTEEEAWKMLTQVAASGTRSATVITGASGILKTKFQQWAKDSVISPFIVSFAPINNGSFMVKFHKNKS
ncbi:MAG: Smr/MutS family protein [Alphaproteobacteria bacterium]|nr:Smr/MutS family protein [Alphaproteobacteria bacterium]